MSDGTTEEELEEMLGSYFLQVVFILILFRDKNIDRHNTSVEPSELDNVMCSVFYYFKGIKHSA